MGLYSCHGNKMSVGGTRIDKLEAVVTLTSQNLALIHGDIQESHV